MANTSRTFLGNFRVTLDAKQRVAIPFALRDTLQKAYPEESDRVIVTVASNEKGISVYPVSSFNEYMATLTGPSELNSETQSMLMFLSSAARDCQIDKQGRIRLPEDLIAYAELDKEAVFCGHVTRMQIWNPARHEGFMNETKAKLSELMRGAEKAINR